MACPRQHRLSSWPLAVPRTGDASWTLCSSEPNPAAKRGRRWTVHSRSALVQLDGVTGRRELNLPYDTFTNKGSQRVLSHSVVRLLASWSAAVAAQQMLLGHHPTFASSVNRSYEDHNGSSCPSSQSPSLAFSSSGPSRCRTVCE